MSRDSQLHALGRIAKLKADIELRQFSTLRRHMATLDHQIETLRAEMIQVADGAAQAWADGTKVETQCAAAPMNARVTKLDAPSAADARRDADGILATVSATQDMGRAPSSDTQMLPDMVPEIVQKNANHPTPFNGVAITDTVGSTDRHLRDARLANALTHALMLEHRVIEDERHRMTLSFEAARAEATRAFGRAEAISSLARHLATARRTQIYRRSGG